MITTAENEPAPTFSATSTDLASITPEQRSQLEYLWALSVIAARQIPTEIAPETASGHVGNRAYQLIAMNNESATSETPGDASRYRFLRTAIWWREIKAMRRTQTVITYNVIDDDKVDEELDQLATEIETAKNILVHRCLFKSWDVTGEGEENTASIVSSLTDKEKMMVLEMQDYLNNLGAYKAIQIAAPEITKLASMYVPTMPKSVPTINNDQLKKVISELLQESVDTMDKGQKAELMARIEQKVEGESDWVCLNCSKSCSEVPYYCMDCGLDWITHKTTVSSESSYQETITTPSLESVALPQSVVHSNPPTTTPATFDSVYMNPHYDASQSPTSEAKETGWV